MLDLAEVKQWLRLEESDTAEDDLLQSLIAAAEEWLRNALECWIDPALNPQAKIVVMTMVADMYENRETTPQIQFAAQLSGMRQTIQSLLQQMRYAYPAITTGTLPVATVGIEYQAYLPVEGGSRPYTWKLLAGSLPAGLALDEGTGKIAGIPTQPGESGVIIQLTDSSPTPKIVSRPVSIEVVEP